MEKLRFPHCTLNYCIILGPARAGGSWHSWYTACALEPCEASQTGHKQRAGEEQASSGHYRAALKGALIYCLSNSRGNRLGMEMFPYIACRVRSQDKTEVCALKWKYGSRFKWAGWRGAATAVTQSFSPTGRLLQASSLVYASSCRRHCRHIRRQTQQMQRCKETVRQHETASSQHTSAARTLPIFQPAVIRWGLQEAGSSRGALPKEQPRCYCRGGWRVEPQPWEWPRFPKEMPGREGACEGLEDERSCRGFMCTGVRPGKDFQSLCGGSSPKTAEVRFVLTGIAEVGAYRQQHKHF